MGRSRAGSPALFGWLAPALFVEPFLERGEAGAQRALLDEEHVEDVARRVLVLGHLAPLRESVPPEGLRQRTPEEVDRGAEERPLRLQNLRVLDGRVEVDRAQARGQSRV